MKATKRRPRASRRATIRAPNSSTAACASSGRNERSGTYVARCRFARIVCAKSASLRPRELLLLGRLLRERLDDVDADDVLLGDGRDVRELLLHVAQRRVGDVAVAVGERDRNGVTASTTSASRHSRKKRTTVTETTVSAFWKKKIRP